MEKIFHIEAEKITLSFDHRRKLHSQIKKGRTKYLKLAPLQSLLMILKKTLAQCHANFLEDVVLNFTC